MFEKVIIGKRTRESIKGNSPELSQIGLIAAGMTSAYSPYEIARDRFKCGHVIATVEGEGEFWHAGKWQKSGEGRVFLKPPHEGEAFRSIKGKVWSFCWLHTFPRFFDAFGKSEARLFDTDVTLFRHAVEGFLHSAFSVDYGRSAGPWADLMRFYAQRFIQATSLEPRLEKVWAAVAAEPARHWDVRELSRIAGMSREQLRVYARQETGRAPMQQVTHLRVQRAIEILQTCNYKQEVVAELVGYENAFVFSNAFLRATGKRPSSYRPKE